MGIKAKNLILVYPHRVSPLIIVLLRTEEVHNVSATAGPIVVILEVHMQDMGC